MKRTESKHQINLKLQSQSENYFEYIYSYIAIISITLFSFIWNNKILLEIIYTMTFEIKLLIICFDYIIK